ncbi:MAG: hypothetical protein BWY36_00161 [Candidatus Diapherotrites archaeon ADurb.Bin253]|nr:MAG: hypothetical protein BWY36_00161 [Candidatus Diapherotrites archaeon ADurb.Bin253]
MKIKEIILGIAIAIIFLMFCVFGTKLIYDEPKYEDYCDYQEFSETDYINESYYTQVYRECSDKYNEANKDYSKKMFIISLIFGILVIVGCTIFISTNSISGGLMFGSLMFIIYGTSRYWNYMDDLVRFIILSIALVVLIYVSYWTSKKMKDGNKRTSKSEKKNKLNQ